ncbi:mycothiol system anti-sigma-R factor [Jatrophihabitans telluris]|uniref:Mycothiol system anti-sigma-R factor n=1 Tax=Jatrophihabitans telluris TaxID=2038343 RepID=A0ABY4R3X1_9ACTN|nr:mycothiol system anti-sigma-R factor [Jatrophihabitans telluris]UQX89806.1 mycothiol system anti-sigma-R factor [Jatrophihabitans telluris]
MMGFGPGGIDCDDVLADVYLYLDDESDPELQGRIRAHLDDCAPCLRQFGLEQDVKSLVARCCGGDVAPDSLKASIRLRLTQVVIETTHVEYRAD